jgi:hypothetical protein
MKRSPASWRTKILRLFASGWLLSNTACIGSVRNRSERKGAAWDWTSSNSRT